MAKLGDWYRVYIGPFPSRQAAKQKATELKKKGIIDYAAIKRQDSRVATTTAISAPVVKKEVKTPLQQPVSQVQQPQPPLEAKATTQATPPPAPKKVVKQEAAVPPPQKKPPKVKSRPPMRTIRGGKGRNIARGNVVFGFTHIYREINTELTERLENGVPTIIDDDLKDNFPTTMNQDTLSLTLGVTDYFQFFAQGGIAYDDLSEPGFVYGGGLRLNLFQTTTDNILPGFYAAIHAAYLSGEFEEEFESINGNKFERESEWQE
ncbi:MAG: SPOR domain-containing protein, partial [Planctomycetota bacterium]